MKKISKIKSKIHVESLPIDIMLEEGYDLRDLDLWIHAVKGIVYIDGKKMICITLLANKV